MRAISRNKNDVPSLRRSKFVVTKIRFIARRRDTTAEVDVSPGFHAVAQCRIKDARCTSGRARSAKKDRDYYRIFMRLPARARL